MSPDLKRLRWNLLMFVFFAALGALAVFASLRFFDEANKGKAKALATLNEVRGKLARANDEAQELREKIVRYHALDKQGIIGQEHRLDWIEQIRKTEKSRKLFDVDYELSPQQPIDKSITVPSAAGLDVMSSAMKIDIPLLHEDDLLNLLSDLQSSVQGYVRLHQCAIDRTPSATTQHGPAAQLKAACQLDWITIREKK